MLREAAASGEHWKQLGDTWTKRFVEDMIALNVRSPDFMPRATSAIEEMIQQIEQLIARGYAYESGGGVYYDIDSWPAYGRLSGLSREEMLPIANERGNDPDDPQKHQPLDFVLWQPQAPDEPAWDSPWGPGRPGWHIECSSMAERHLGTTVDVHAGGSDLIYPHHESEIAQSEALSGESLARNWMHIAMVEYHGEKMSKSLENLVLVSELLQSWSPNVVRLYLAGHHYREPWSYSESELEPIAHSVEALARIAALEGGSGPEFDSDDFQADLLEALEADLDTPAAIAVILQLANAIDEAAGHSQDIERAQSTLISLAGILGLRLRAGPPAPEFLDGWLRHLA